MDSLSMMLLFATTALMLPSHIRADDGADDVSGTLFASIYAYHVLRSSGW